jgi:hypothetical protein
MTGWKRSGGRALSIEDEIEGLKRMIGELRSENCNEAADILCEELQQLHQEQEQEQDEQ